MEFYDIAQSRIPWSGITTYGFNAWYDSCRCRSSLHGVC
jgi:hypothetical protein